MTLPSPSKLRSASSRSEMLGKRSSEGTSNSGSDPASAPVPPASPPRWRRDRFQVRSAQQSCNRSYCAIPAPLLLPVSSSPRGTGWQMDTATTAARSISGTVDTGSPLRPRVPSSLSARSNASHTPGRTRTGGSSGRMTLGAQAPAGSSVVPVLPTLTSSGVAVAHQPEQEKAMCAHDNSLASGGMDLMAVSPAPAAADDLDRSGVDGLPADLGRLGNAVQPAALKFELPTAVKPSNTSAAPAATVTKASTLPPASKSSCASREKSSDDAGGADGIAGGGKSVGSKPLVAVAPRARRGADHLVDKLVKHLDTAEGHDEHVDAMGAVAVCPYTSSSRHAIIVHILRQGHPVGADLLWYKAPGCSFVDSWLMRACVYVRVFLTAAAPDQCRL
jgi:hypothetical protein